MPKSWVWLVAMLFATLSAATQAQVAASESWRLHSVRPAPWAQATGPAGAGPLPPAEWRVDAQGMSGPTPLTCSAARHRFLRLPAEHLFEGNLPVPATLSAQQLGLPAGPLITQRIACNSGSFDFHRDAADHAWLGLDNRVLRFERVASVSSPTATVQALLLAHFAADMALNLGSVAAKSAWLSLALQQRLDRWLKLPPSPDEVPALNGDPFTDSQEPPLAFELAAAEILAASAEVTIRFEFAGDQSGKLASAPTRNVVMLLTKSNGDWRIDDLRYADGSRLSQLLGL